MEAECIRTVTFFKIPVYKINFSISIDKNSREISTVSDILKSNDNWTLQIFPIRKINTQHLTNSLVQKLIAISEDNNNLSQIYKFKSLIPQKDSLLVGDKIEFTCSSNQLIVRKNDEAIGEMQNISICSLLSRVYLDASFRGVPCIDLITELNAKLKNETKPV
jgi:hypothetical protein